MHPPHRSWRRTRCGVPDTAPPRRIDRIYGVTRRNQRDRYLGLIGVLAQLRTNHVVQPGDPGHALGEPCLGQRLPGLVHQLDIVMILRPIVTHEQLMIAQSALFGAADAISGIERLAPRRPHSRFRRRRPPHRPLV